MIQENSEQTRTELMAHPGLKSPLRPCPHPRNTELFNELTDRRLNAAAHSHLELPEILRILLLLIAPQRRQQTGVFGFKKHVSQGTRNIPSVAKQDRIPAPFTQQRQHRSVVYIRCKQSQNQ